MPPKRKSSASASTSSSSKKPKPPPTVILGKAALTSLSEGGTLDGSQVNDLVAYIQTLENRIGEYQKAATSLNHKGGKELSDSDIVTEAERLRGIVERGIVKLMKVGIRCQNKLLG